MAAAIGAAAWWLKRKGVDKMNTPGGDRVTIGPMDPRRLRGVVSLVQRSEDRDPGNPTDLAISLPINEHTAKTLQEKAETAALFAMQRQSPERDSEHRVFARPLTGRQEDVKQYSQHLGTAARWVWHALSSTSKKENRG